MEVLHELLALEDAPRTARQEVEHRELAARDRHRGAAVRHLVAPGVDRERSAPDDVGVLRLRVLRGPPAATREGADPTHELPGAVRLRHVVVGAEVEAQEQVVLRGARGEEEDRDVGLGAEHPAHVEAVEPGHHHVEHEDVGCPTAHLVERGAPVADHDDVVALALRVEPDEGGLLGVVLGDHQVRHGARLGVVRSRTVMTTMMCTVPDRFLTPSP